MALRPILVVYTRDMGYEGGGKLQVQWWRQAAADNQLKVTVEAILVAARVWQQQEYGRRGKSKGGYERESKCIEW